MPRKRTEKLANQPYHVCNRVLSKKNYPSELMNQLWQVYCDELCIVSWAYNVKIHIFVLMSNHYHMVLETPDRNIDEAMKYFQRQVSKSIKELTHSQDYRFQSRYSWKVISNAVQYENTYRYVARNPVEANLCSYSTEYRFSSLNGQFGNATLRFPIFEASTFSGILPVCMMDREKWLRCQIQVPDIGN